MNKVNSKKGFTVVELVVAMAIIVIVAGTAIAIINTQNTIYLRTMQTVEATNMAENAIECFRWAVENPDTEGGVNKAFYDAFEKTGCELKNVADDAGKYYVETNGMTVEIIVEGNTISISAYDGDKEILEKSYTKQ